MPTAAIQNADLVTLIRTRAAELPSLPLLPDAGVLLHLAPTVRSAVGRRFADLFREAWHRLPVDARRALLKHWLAETRFAAPFVAVVEGMTAFIGCAAAGCCGLGGRCLFFCPRWLRRLDDELVRTAAAHELAHAWHWATKGHGGTEDEADDLTRRWGFTRMGEFRRA